jgi:hypothetical protein
MRPGTVLHSPWSIPLSAAGIPRAGSMALVIGAIPDRYRQ